MPFLTPDNAAMDNAVCRRIWFPDDELWLAIIKGLLHDICLPWNFEKFGTLTPEQCAEVGNQIFELFAESDCMLGAIFPYATASPPTSCLPCDGSTYLRADYPRLYAKLDPMYIVDSDNFVTPDLRDLFILSSGTTYSPGDTGGAAAVALTEAQNAQHSHGNDTHTHTDTGHTHGEITAITSTASPPVPPAVIPSAIPGAGITGISYATLSSTVINIHTSGSSEEHENMPPYTTLSYCIVAK